MVHNSIFSESNGLLWPLGAPEHIVNIHNCTCTCVYTHNFKNSEKCKARWYMPVVPELKKWKLGNYTFKAILGYISKYEATFG